MPDRDFVSSARFIYIASGIKMLLASLGMRSAFIHHKIVTISAMLVTATSA